jgi:BlaI family transcriptional regulator, penicillinase repressor
MPRKRARELSDAEWELMSAVWEIGGGVTVREVLERAHPDGEKAYTTVQTLMNILCEKGFLRRTKRGTLNHYAPRVGRDAALRRSLGGAAERMFDGSFGAMATWLVNARTLTSADIEALRTLLDEQEAAS